MSSKYKYILSFFVFILFSISVFAANFSSTNNGDWSADATWGGSSHPALSTADNITIYDDVTTSSNITIKSGGYLTIKAGASLTVNDMEFSNGSHVIIEAGGQLIVLGNLTNKNNSEDVEVNGDISVDGNFDNGNGGVVFGDGSIQVDGSFTGDGTTFDQENDTITAGTTVTGGSLPVELLYFKYLATTDEILLKWATASETSNDFFTIEQSADGVNFKEIAFIAGSGNSNNEITYSYSDKEPLPGDSYYRLKQTDFDGKSEYIGLLSCTLESNNDIDVVFENPVRKDNFNITFSTDGIYIISLTNYNGQLVFSSKESVNGLSSLKIPASQLNSGFYLMNITDIKGFSSSYKIIVQ